MNEQSNDELLENKNEIKKLLLIINPCSGIKKSKLIFENAEEIIKKQGWQVDVKFTEYRNHATELAANAIGYERIICMGGDGTLNETINGIMKNPNPIDLGYIPAGSTNDFASGLGLSKIIRKSSKFAATEKAYPTDIGYFHADESDIGRRFSYVASFGIFTDVSYGTEQKIKNVFGKMAYIFEGIRTVAELQSFKPFRLRIELDDGTCLEQEYIFGAVTNSTSLGGLMKLDKKHVKVDDGQFELLLIRAPQNLVTLTETVGELINHKYRSENIVFGHVKKVKMISEIPLHWTLDGEYAGKLSTADISVSEHALDLVRPNAVRDKPFMPKRRP